MDRRWTRFSLRTLLLFTLLMASATLLWNHRYPWRLERSWDSAPEGISPGDPSNIRVYFTPDGQHLVTFRAIWNFFPDQKSPSKVQRRSVIAPTARMWDLRTAEMSWSYSEGGAWDCGQTDCILSPGGKWVCLGRTVAGAHAIRPRAQISPDDINSWMVTLLNVETGKPMELPESLVAEAKRDAANPLPPGASIDNPVSTGLLLDRIAITNDDALVAVGWKGKVHVFNPENHTELCVLNEKSEEAVPLNFYSNNRCLVVVYETPEGNVHDIWELRPARLSRSSAMSDGLAYVNDEGEFSAAELMKAETLLVERFAPQPGHRTSVVKNLEDRERVRGREIEISRDFEIVSARESSGMHEIIQKLDGDYTIKNAVAITPDDSSIAILTENGAVYVWLKHRPVEWTGLFWLPEFWLTFAVALGLVWSKWRDGRASM